MWGTHGARCCVNSLQFGCAARWMRRGRVQLLGVVAACIVLIVLCIGGPEVSWPKLLKRRAVRGALSSMSRVLVKMFLTVSPSASLQNTERRLCRLSEDTMPGPQAESFCTVDGVTKLFRTAEIHGCYLLLVPGSSLVIINLCHTARGSVHSRSEGIQRPHHDEDLGNRYSPHYPNLQHDEY